MPPGDAVGDILRWDGSFWQPRQLDDLVGEMLDPHVYIVTTNGAISNAVPVGYKLVHITLINRESYSVTISLGLTTHGTELLDNESIASHNWIDIQVDRILSISTASAVWVQAVETLTALGFIMIIETKLFYTP
jgi:hypothetical protein